MNRQIDAIVAEVTCMNNQLNESSELPDFQTWLDEMKASGFDRSEYPNFNAYFADPLKYWPYIARSLQQVMA